MSNTLPSAPQNSGSRRLVANGSCAAGTHPLSVIGPIMLAIVLFGGLGFSARAPAQGNSAPPPYRDISLSPEARAADLVSRMTLEEKVPQLMNDAPAINRLGVREYNWWNEGLHGVAAAGVATVFPQAIGMAATWDSELMLRVQEDLEGVAHALQQANRGAPFKLTFEANGAPVYVNPEGIAYWFSAGAPHE